MFKNIDECICGLLAVSKQKEHVKLYNPKNCIICHELKGETREYSYGIIDVQNRKLYLTVKAADIYNHDLSDICTWELQKPLISIREYLGLLLEGAGCKLVQNREEAETVISVEKQDKCVSLIDNNFFFEK